MKTKYKRIASKMREDLYRQLKVLSAVEGIQIQDLLEEAVLQYLERRKVTEKQTEDGEWTVRFSCVPRVSEKKEKESG